MRTNPEGDPVAHAHEITSIGALAGQFANEAVSAVRDLAAAILDPNLSGHSESQSGRPEVPDSFPQG